MFAIVSITQCMFVLLSVQNLVIFIGFTGIKVGIVSVEIIGINSYKHGAIYWNTEFNQHIQVIKEILGHRDITVQMVTPV